MPRVGLFRIICTAKLGCHICRTSKIPVDLRVQGRNLDAGSYDVPVPRDQYAETGFRLWGNVGNYTRTNRVLRHAMDPLCFTLIQCSELVLFRTVCDALLVV